jgi:hypothetical protein
MYCSYTPGGRRRNERTVLVQLPFRGLAPHRLRLTPLDDVDLQARRCTGLIMVSATQP